jgi:pSer/pThr/pTyr-binding forkhead associated (FHA) protein
MASATLKFDEKELNIGEEITIFGRTPDNDVSFPDNSNVSRNHAKIEFREGKYRLTDLGSSNGTTVNGQAVTEEFELNNGDFITLGNSVIIEFLTEDEESEDAAEQSNESPAILTNTADTAVKSAKFPVLLAVTGAICGLAVVFAVAAAYVGLSGRNTVECNASARILNPLNGQAISQETQVKIEVNNSGCVKKVHVVMNGKLLATLEESPYTATINPNDFPELADGGLYNLQVLLEDADGKQIGLPREVALQFETKEIVTDTPDDNRKITPTQTPIQPTGKQISVIETQKMTATVVSKFTGASAKYNISNPEFLRLVQQKTAEYSSAAGYSQRATNFKTVIDQSFIREKGIDSSLAYILAMSRSKFNPEKQAGEGLWQMSPEFATANSYNVVCSTFSLSDSTQECSSKVASIYLSELLPLFDGDIIYTVAAFGKSTQDASIWRGTLPADRSDFWNVITDQNQRDLIVRFFAAAIVAENPSRFKMKNDVPISQLYPPVGSN